MNQKRATRRREHPGRPDRPAGDIWVAVKFVLECDYFNGRTIDVDGASRCNARRDRERGPAWHTPSSDVVTLKRRIASTGAPRFVRRSIRGSC